MARVVIGTPVYRQGAYILDRFLSNQREIQQDYQSCELVLATVERDFGEELKQLLDAREIRGEVLFYDVAKPVYARSPVWNIASGREAIRRHVLSRTGAGYLLFLDADMTFDPSVVERMIAEMRGYGAVFSGYPLRRHGTGLAGAGCLMLDRDTLGKVEFRCCEFRNGEVIYEDNMLEMDLFRLGCRVKKGFFLPISHYVTATLFRSIGPRPVGLLSRIANLPLIRYCLIRTSIMIRCNIPWRIKIFLNVLAGAVSGNRAG